MDKYTEKYKKYKKAVEIQDRYKNRGRIGNLKIRCSICNKTIAINGATAHYKIHKTIYDDKIKFIKEKFNAYNYSVLSGKKIEYTCMATKNRYIVVCNSKEYLKIYNYIRKYEAHYKKCPICGKYFLNTNKTCSRVCSKKLVGIGIKSFFSNPDNLKKIEARNKKISEKSKIYNKGRVPWNKGMTGTEYMKHYEKEDGTNSLIQGMINSKFIIESSIEIKLKKFLLENNFNFEHSWFCCNKQFDFLISLSKNVLIVECDGDYWHKSKRRCFDADLRKMKRVEDKLKEKIIYENIENTDKKWHVVRFWEYDINNNFDRICSYLFNIRNSEHNITDTTEDIEKWYDEQS